MSVLTARGLGKYYGAQDVFSGVDLQIGGDERIALVGANGAGKTSLLRVLAGLETPTSGTVHKARSLKIGYLPQEATIAHDGIDGSITLWGLMLGAFGGLRTGAEELRLLEELMARAEGDEQEALMARYGEAQTAFELAGGYTYETQIKRVLGGLGFSDEEYHRPLDTLSGGQQTRAQLARLLLESPGLLLLDEPTNHLDLDAIEWLEDYLANWKGAVVVVAHDRYFLDRVAVRIWEMENRGLETYRGNYTSYVLQKEERAREVEHAYREQQAFIAKEEEFIRRNIAGQRTKEAQGRRKRLERLERIERTSRRKNINLRLREKGRSGNLVLEAQELVVGYPGHPLFTCPELELRRGECAAILGPNGTGKSTFIKTILGEMQPLGGKMRTGAALEVGYMAQAHAGLNFGNSVLDEILSVKNVPLAQARDFLAGFLFLGDDVFKPIGVLSGGERARVALAKLTLRGANLLMLDEPTGHLDMASRETLRDVLSGFEGTIILSSHDRHFVDALATQIWAIEKGVLYVTGGGYSEYFEERDARRRAAEEEKAPVSNGESDSEEELSKRSREEQKRLKREREKRARRVAELEAAIEDAETHLAELSDALEKASLAGAVDRLERLGRDYQGTSEKLTQLLEEWTTMEAT